MPLDLTSVGSFADRAVKTAINEWNFFGNQTMDISGAITHQGHKEGESNPNPGQEDWYKRVGDYWVQGTGTHGIDGQNHDWPWSAAFISWVMEQAGAGNSFRYSTQHSVYISQAIRDRLNGRQAAGYWGFRLSEGRPAIGDIVCWGREPGVDYDHQKGGDYAGHSDLVVAVNNDQIEIIGGNVGDSVTRRPLNLDNNGFLATVVENGENLFAIMKNRLG